MSGVIDLFSNKNNNGGWNHSFLSNFWTGNPFWGKLVIPTAEGFPNGIVEGEWQTSEHYYQAAKATNVMDAVKIRDVGTPGAAKKAGRNVRMRADWDEIKIGVMRDALDLKFDFDRPEAQMLLDTGEALLVEGNTWGDRFWGVDDGLGQNWLGWLLMAKRAHLRAVLLNRQGRFPLD